jgi:YebC/PmpR family DNA-binding regulatory protein
MGRAFEYRKARKMKRWGQMAKSFTKIGREIVMAVKAGSADPTTNSKLRAIIQNAKAINMPKENVEKAIKRATSKDEADYKEIVYEGRGPHKIAIIVECATDNHNRTVANLRSYFTRSGGTLEVSGALDFLFERKCHFRIEDTGINVEEFELEMIDFGVEEVFADEGEVAIYAAPNDFGAIQKALEDRKFNILKAEFERIPQETKELTPEQEEELQKLLDKLDEDEDVQNVYHNMR